MAVHRLNDIGISYVQRLSTGMEQLDQIFGYTKDPLRTSECGLPLGCISFLSGGRGTGKTRLAIKIAQNVAQRGLKVMVFQGEVRPEEFKQWTGSFRADNFWVSDDSDLETIMEILSKYRPHLVIIDSANMIDGYSKLAECRNIFDQFKVKVAEIGCH